MLSTGGKDQDAGRLKVSEGTRRPRPRHMPTGPEKVPQRRRVSIRAWRVVKQSGNRHAAYLAAFRRAAQYFFIRSDTAFRCAADML